MSKKMFPPAVPLGRTIRRTKDGVQYDFNSPIWGKFLSGGRFITISFGRIDELASLEVGREFREIISRSLLKNSASHSRKMVVRFRELLEYIVAEGLDYPPIAKIGIKYLMSFRLNAKAESFRFLIAVLREFSEESSLLDAEARDFLWNWKRTGTYRDNEYEAVLTLDPEKGPFLDSEILAIDNSLLAALESGEINAERYLLAMTFRLYGVRPISCSDLTLGDIQTPKHTGSSQVLIRFPVNKQRNPDRSHSPLRPVPVLFGRLMEEYVEERRNSCPDINWKELPLFPFDSDTWKEKRNVSVHQLPGGFASPDVLSWRYVHTMQSLSVVSPRTEKRMIISPRRDRHTVGTLLALQGCSAESIASWLEHKSTESCEAYVEIATRHYQLMSSLLDGKFTHLAGRFFGKVIDADALKGFNIESVIFDSENDGEELGGCHAGGCPAIESLSAPYACFLCPNFRLSSEADLAPLLAVLVKKRHSAIQLGLTEFSVSLDRHIAAVYAARTALEASS